MLDLIVGIINFLSFLLEVAFWVGLFILIVIYGLYGYIVYQWIFG